MEEDTTRKGKVFVTVGTTSFDALIERVVSEAVLQVLESKGFSSILLQIGRGKFEPHPTNGGGVKLTYYRYKNSITEDIRNADLVISHAGAGSVLETLNSGRPLLVVINDSLMDNHQVELAAAMAKEGFLFYTTCGKLKETLLEMDLSSLVPYSHGKPEIFGTFMDSVLGFS